MAKSKAQSARNALRTAKAKAKANRGRMIQKAGIGAAGYLAGAKPEMVRRASIRGVPGEAVVGAVAYGAAMMLKGDVGHGAEGVGDAMLALYMRDMGASRATVSGDASADDDAASQVAQLEAELRSAEDEVSGLANDEDEILVEFD